MDSKKQIQKREIKFRAWDEKLKMMTTPFIDFLIFEESENFKKGQVLHQHFEDEEFVPIELMQYTGLKDKNGKEIYEGDIYRYADDAPKVIEFENGIFGYRIFNRIHPLFFGQTENKHEVIGNIYENPELL